MPGLRFVTAASPHCFPLSSLPTTRTLASVLGVRGSTKGADHLPGTLHPNPALNVIFFPNFSRLEMSAALDQQPLTPLEDTSHPVWCPCPQGRARDKNLRESVHLGGGPWNQEGGRSKVKPRAQRGESVGQHQWSVGGSGSPLQKGRNGSRAAPWQGVGWAFVSTGVPLGL